MKIKIIVFVCFIFLDSVILCWSSEVDKLAEEGYTAVVKTKIVGDYYGCTASKVLRFTDGSVFLCSTFGYDNDQYMPDVTVYKNKDGKLRIAVRDKVFSGSFVEPQ